jgi:hypothetical protein
MQTMIDRLRSSEEAAIRYQTRLYVLGADPAAEEMRQMQEEIRSSPRVQQLLS